MDKNINELSKAVFGLQQSVNQLVKNTESRNLAEEFAYGKGVSKFDDRLSTSYPKIDARVKDSVANEVGIFKTPLNVKRINVAANNRNAVVLNYSLIIQLGYVEDDIQPLNDNTLRMMKNVILVPAKNASGSSGFSNFEKVLDLNYPVVGLSIAQVYQTGALFSINAEQAGRPWVFSVAFQGY